MNMSPPLVIELATTPVVNIGKNRTINWFNRWQDIWYIAIAVQSLRMLSQWTMRVLITNIFECGIICNQSLMNWTDISLVVIN